MKIQHHVAALNNYRQQGMHGQVVSNTLEKLSSGQRIVRAADDASGMAISEKMRAQIRGLNQAARNLQDGLSLVATMESAIGEMQNPNLVRMRELVIQAANAPLTSEEHAVIQREIQQLAEEVDRLARDTEFNTMPVLGPSRIEGEEMREMGAFDIVFFIDDSSSMGESITLVKDGLGAFMSNIEQYGTVQVGTQSLVHDRPNSHPLTSQYEDVKRYMELHHQAKGGMIAPYEQMLHVIERDDFGFRPYSEKIFILLTDTHREDGSEEAKQELESKLKELGIQTYLFGVQFRNNGNTYPDTHYERDFNFVDGFVRPQTKEEIAEGISPGIADLIISSTDGVEKFQKDLMIQAGANSFQQIEIQTFDLRAATLHIKDLEVDTYERAMQSLRRIDQASKQLTEYRTYYGVLHNRMEHALNQVTSGSEYLTRTLSTIQDQDLAKGMSHLTKQQIMLQASQAVGVQLSERVQSVLQLLK